MLTSEGASLSVLTRRRSRRAEVLISWPPHPFVGDLLPRLHAWLVEGVDAVEGAGYGGLHFEGLEEVAEVLFVYHAEPYGRVGVAGLGEGPPRGVALDVQELCHGVSPEVADAFQVLVGFRYSQVARMLFDFDDLDHLVLRPFHIELDLRVLVRGTDRTVGRRALAVFAE